MRLRRARCVWIASLLTAFLTIAPQAARGQATTGSIAGTVLDAQRLVVAGARVTAVSEASGATVASAVSDATGRYRLTGLPPDLYRIEVSGVAGFRTSVRTGVRVTAGETVAAAPLILEL